MGTYLGRLCPCPPHWVLDSQQSVTLPTNWPAMTTCCACISIYFKASLHYVCAYLAAMPCSLILEIVFQNSKGTVPFLEFLSLFCTCCLQTDCGKVGKRCLNRWKITQSYRGRPTQEGSQKTDAT